MVAFGTGIYSTRDAALLLHEKPETVARWAFGYRRIRRGAARLHPPLIHTELPVLDGARALTFVEVVELLYIRAFVRAGATWSVIREAARIAARICLERGNPRGAEHPFATRHLFVDPEGLLYCMLNEADGDDEGIVQLRGHGQHVIPAVIRPYLDEIDFDVSSLARLWWPLGRGGGVVVDPQRAFGKPVLDGTALSARTVARMVEAERGRYRNAAAERVAWIYEIQPQQVHHALQFETWLSTAR